MPKKKPEVEEEVVEELEEELPAPAPQLDVEPKTELGRRVKDRSITDINYILDKGLRIQEAWIVDALVPNIETELLLIGQAKGKFGGGKRRVFKQTQKKTREGNKPRFGTAAIVGNKDGIIGVGYGKSKETVPAREKAFRNAKLNIYKIRRGCGSWECSCGEAHSLPFAVHGRCSSVRLTLLPAPKGTGLCVEKEIAKMLQLAGIKDVWSKSLGQTRTKMNLIKATEDALRQLLKTKIQEKHIKLLSVVEGAMPKIQEEIVEEKEEEKPKPKPKKETKSRKKKSEGAKKK